MLTPRMRGSGFLGGMSAAMTFQTNKALCIASTSGMLHVHPSINRWHRLVSSLATGLFSNASERTVQPSSPAVNIEPLALQSLTYSLSHFKSKLRTRMRLQWWL